MTGIPKRRVIILLGLILLAAFLSISMLNYFSARNSMRSEIVNSSLPLLRENIYSTILRDLLPSMHTASLMSNDSFLIEWALNGEQDVGSIQDYLTRIRDRYGFISAFVVSEATQKYYHPMGVHKTISKSDPHDVWYCDLIASGQLFDLDVNSDEAADDQMTIFINYRLEDRDGRLLSVTGVGLEMNGFSSFLARQRRLFDRQIYLVDETGYIQAHSDTNLIEKLNIRNIDGLSDLSAGILTRSVEHDQHAAMADVRLHLIESLVIADILTGASNRRALESALPRMLYRSKRRETDLSLLVIDMDHFKEVNDQYGHQEGDRVLRNFAGIISDTIRNEDLLVRLGGDEFLVATETDADGAMRIARDIVSAFGKDEPRITLSCGIAIAIEGDSPEDVVKKADEAMYRAKSEGRNRIVLYDKSQ